MIEINLSELITQLRKDHHLTQQQVADAIGVQRSAYAYYEIGKSMPKFPALVKLAAIYDMSVDEMIGSTLDEDEKRIMVAEEAAPYNVEFQGDVKFNELSSFEKSIVLKTRLMSKSEKTKLVSFIHDMEASVLDE